MHTYDSSKEIEIAGSTGTDRQLWYVAAFPRKAMPMGAVVHNSSSERSQRTERPMAKRPQLAHLSAEEADALASLGDPEAADLQPVEKTKAVHHYDRGGRGP